MKAKGIIYIPFGILSVITAVAGAVLSSTVTFADESTVTTAVTVLEACSMTRNASASTEHEISMVGGRYESSIGTSAIDVTCNDRNGYSVYVMGVDGTAQENPDTNLTGQSLGQVITTGTDMSITTDSHWAMRLSAVNDSAAYYVPTIVNDFDSNHVVPATYTKAVTFSNGINISKPSRFTTTYAVAVTSYQAPDVYVGHVKYLLVHPNYASEDGKVYMQDVTDQIVADIAEGTSATFTDSRDGNDYTVKKINGQLWMTQNLRFTGTSVPAATSNVTTDAAMTYYSLDANDASYTDHCDATNGYNYACIKDSGNATTGVWYNYYAASAGTISTNSNSTATTEDICPKNWHLPIGPNTTADTDFNKLVGNTTAGWQDPTSGLTAFGAVAGGGYNSGSLDNTGIGYWWSATASSASGRYNLGYNSSDGQFNGSRSGNRFHGLFVRCVRSS